MEGIRRVFGGNPDSFKLVFEYGRDSTTKEQSSALPAGQVRLPVALATMEFEFNSNESEAAVLERFTQAKSKITFDRLEERIVLKLTAKDETSGGVKASISLACITPVLRCVQVVRTSSTGNVPEALLTALLKHCELGGVWKLRGAEGFGNFWCSCCEVRSWRSLANLNLSACGLASLPPALGQLSSLRLLRLSYNRLAALPAELSCLTALEVLAADHNLLAGLPAELRHCSSLRHLELEGNRLATPLLDLRALSRLVSLQLYGNPLELLPELSPAAALRSLSVANVRIMADAAYTRWEVEVAPLPYISRGHKLAPLFKLTFRRSSCQHPLLAGALGRLSEERGNAELMSRDETAVQQLVLMALSEQPVVAEQACRTLGALAQLGLATARRLLAHDVVSTILTLLRSRRPASQLCGLQLLANLAAASEHISAELLSLELLQLLQDCVGAGGQAEGGSQAEEGASGSDPRVTGATAAQLVSSPSPSPPAPSATAAMSPGVMSPAAVAVAVAMGEASSSGSSGGGGGLNASGGGSSSSSSNQQGVTAAELRVAALTALANLAFARDNKLKIRAASGLLATVIELAMSSPTSSSSQAAGAVAGGAATAANAAAASPHAGQPLQAPSGTMPAATAAGNGTAAGGPGGGTTAPRTSPSALAGPQGSAERPMGHHNHRASSTSVGGQQQQQHLQRHSDTGGSGAAATAAGGALQLGTSPPGATVRLPPPPHSSSPYNSFSTTTAHMGTSVSAGGWLVGPAAATTAATAAAGASGSGLGSGSDPLSPPLEARIGSGGMGGGLHHSASTPAAIGLSGGGAGAAPPTGFAALAAAASRALSPVRATHMPTGVTTTAATAAMTPASAIPLAAPTTTTTSPSSGGGLLMSPTSPTAADVAAAAGAFSSASAASAAAAAAAGLPPQISQAPPRAVPEPVALRDQCRLLAIKVLAILGENEQVRRAVGQPAISGRGLRVLALDGGGMRGLALVQIMRNIERRVGRPLHQLFDLVVGTSTGAIVAVGLGLFHFSLDQCEAVYTGLGHKVFNQATRSGSGSAPGSRTPREELMAAAQAQAAAQAAAAQAAAAAAAASSSSSSGTAGGGSSSGGAGGGSSSGSSSGWFDGMFSLLRGTSTNLRVAVYGFKHDASTFEELLRQMCDIKKLGCVGNQLIDAAALGGPKVAAVATLVSVCPVTPFLFTSYELPPEVAPAAAAMRACPSSSRHLIWQAVRASSAAPYYLDDYVCGDDRYQDGAATANNPSILALQQARLLWPHTPLAALVSIGCGTAPSVRRERGAHAVLDTGAVLVDAATSPDRADEALSTLLPLVPGVRYFRFQPVHERCAMELDDVNPQHWAALQAAVDEYCSAHAARFDELAELLREGSGQEEEEVEGGEAQAGDGEGGEAAEDQDQSEEEEEAFEAPEGVGPDGAPLPLVPRVRLGPRRGLLLVEAPAPLWPPPASTPPTAATPNPGLPTPAAATAAAAAPSTVAHSTLGTSGGFSFTPAGLQGPLPSGLPYPPHSRPQTPVATPLPPHHHSHYRHHPSTSAHHLHSYTNSYKHICPGAVEQAVVAALSSLQPSANPHPHPTLGSHPERHLQQHEPNASASSITLPFTGTVPAG
ncbi:hypothetical protein Agub_g2103, partial [Astrephomene gubernaculifera]